MTTSNPGPATRTTNDDLLTLLNRVLIAIEGDPLDPVHKPGLVRGLQTEQKTRRRHIRLLVVAIIVDVLLSLTALGLGYELKHVNDKQRHQARTSQVTNCKSGNEARIGIRQSFDLTLGRIEDLAAKTPDQRAQFDALRLETQKVLTEKQPLRDCTKVGANGIAPVVRQSTVTTFRDATTTTKAPAP